jgi:hypothetical protein
MTSDDPADLTPAIFDGVSLTPEEQAKVDILRADWERRGSKAIEGFIQAEISLCLKAMDHIYGREAVADTLRQVMTEEGITAADLRRMLLMKPKPH